MLVSRTYYIFSSRFVTIFCLEWSNKPFIWQHPLKQKYLFLSVTITKYHNAIISSPLFPRVCSSKSFSFPLFHHRNCILLIHKSSDFHLRFQLALHFYHGEAHEKAICTCLYTYHIHSIGYPYTCPLISNHKISSGVIWFGLKSWPSHLLTKVSLSLL